MPMLIIAYMTIHQNGETGALRQYDMQDYRSEPRNETKELNGWSLEMVTKCVVTCQVVARCLANTIVPDIPDDPTVEQVIQWQEH